MGFRAKFIDRTDVTRRTVRLRLTLVYSALFVVSAVILLALTYTLVDTATRGALSYQGEQGINGTIDELPGRRSADSGDGPQLTPGQLDEQVRLLRDRAIQQRAASMRELVIQAGIALAIMSATSLGLGWIMAGRILRPLRTITAAVREISATDLHRRLDLTGPNDELKRLGETFDDLLDRLEASFQAQRQFVANASHELRTPLARQRVLVQVALSDPDATVESLRAAHERVLAASAQQERLITALLTLASGQAGFEVRERFDLAVLAEHALTTRRPEAESRGLTMRARLDAAPTTGSASLAERLVTNLTDNALRHNRRDGEVDIVTDVVGGRPEFCVSNTGPVISHAELERLFQPFQRLESKRVSSADGGLGLGLSIVEAIATVHGAAIHANPRPGGGLSIRVIFPAVEDGTPAREPVARASGARPTL